MDRQVQKYKKYKEIFGDLDEQFKDADLNQKEHVHANLKNHEFINQMIEKNSLNSKGEGLFKMSDEEIYELLKQTGCLYGKIISSSEFEE